MPATTITIQRGSYAFRDLTFTRAGVALDLTGALVSWVMRWDYPTGTVATDTDAVLNKTIGSGLIVSAPANGVATLVLYPADTKALEFDASTKSRSGVWGAEVTLAGDPGPCELDDSTGVFVLTADVARAQ